MLPKHSRFAPTLSVLLLSCSWIAVIAAARYAFGDDCGSRLCKETTCYKDVVMGTCWKFSKTMAEYLHSANATGGSVNPKPDDYVTRLTCANAFDEPDCVCECGGGSLPANTEPNCGTYCSVTSMGYQRTECIQE
jgi:hypothetical protein